jgi:hypothetical protein
MIKSRMMRLAGHVAHMGEMRNSYIILVGKPERKRALGIPGRSWEYNIKMDLREIGVGICGVEASGSGYGPMVGPCEHSNEL